MDDTALLGATAGADHDGDFWPAIMALAADVSGRADEIEAKGELPHDLVTSLLAAGAMQVCVPRSAGGLDRSPLDWFRMVRMLAHADGSTGWLFSQPALLAAQLAVAGTPAMVAAVGDPGFVYAGSVAGRVTARRTDDGFAVESARWAFESGCTHATMIGGVIVVRGDDGTPPELRMALAPASAFTIERTWSARGLTATASHDVILGRWCFPEEWTLPFPPPVHADVPFAHVAVGAWPASGACAAVQLGLAEAALDEAVRQAREKRRAGQSGHGIDQGHFHLGWGRARSRYDAASAAMEVALEAAWAQASTGRDISLDQRAALRMASAHAVRESAAVVRTCADLVGADSLYRRNRLERIFRDAHVLTHHVSVSDPVMAAVSRALLRLDPDDGWT